jgi:hypothetical protein
VAALSGVPVPGFSAALSYDDSLSVERLPAALIQGQRDFFGAHTYKRLDRPGTFHTIWTPEGAPEVVASTPSTRQMWEGGHGEGDRSPRQGELPPQTDMNAVITTAEADPELEANAESGDRSPRAVEKAEY